MNYRTTISTYKAIITIAILSHSCILPLQRSWQLAKISAGTMGAGFATKYIYDLKKNKDLSYQGKKLLIVSPATQQWEPIPAMHNMPSDVSSSPTYNHIVALHDTTWPSHPNQKIFDEKCLDILAKYYPDGPLQLPLHTKTELCAATRYLIAQEVTSAENYYTVYHGTDNTVGILFRTMLNQKINDDSSDILCLRDNNTKDVLADVEDITQHLKDVKNAERKRLQKEYCQKYIDDKRWEHVGLLFGSSSSASQDRMNVKMAVLPEDYNNILLSVNYAALANSYPAHIKGSNSLRYLTDIQRTNDVWSFLTPANKQSKAEADINEIIATIQSYGANPAIIEKYLPEIEELSSNIGGMLIQLQIPKNEAPKITLCGSFNSPIGTADKKLASMQKPLTDTDILNIDHKHMVLPLSIFHHPAQGTRMNSIIRADEKKLMQLTTLLENVSEEIHKDLIKS